jgi:ubiquinone/menaquinone biosynthesis C-methylase UbiE
VLDVGCGPGALTCAFARRAAHATGIDITPAVIERARQFQTERSLDNVCWQVEDVLPLPFTDEAFSIVATRHTFHHFVEPAAVLREMARVCRGDGKILVVDVTPAGAMQDAFNQMEKLRDPSHFKALTLSELLDLHASAGLRLLRSEACKLEMEVESLLAASFPRAGDAERIRAMFEEDLAKGSLGLGTHRRDSLLHFAYPIAIILSQKR